MKFKLKLTGIPKTTGILLKPLTSSEALTGYQSQDEGLDIKEVYIQQKTAVIAGEILGTDINVWIPKKIFIDANIFPDREDKLIVDNIEYTIKDIMLHEYGLIEDHYELNILRPNE